MVQKRDRLYDRIAELSIYLRPEYTGRGLGTIVLGYLEGPAKKAGIHVLIGTLCGENLASIRLTDKSGFTRCACLKNVGENFGKILDVLIYQKEI